jgi:MFS family permease
MMVVLDTTIVNVAVDTLSRELHSPLSSIQWVATGYLLSLAAVIPLGSGLCALARSASELIGFRILQALAAGC